MSEKKNRVFIGQVHERTGKYGKFLSGRIGAAQLVVSESKEPGKWNVYLEENQMQERKEAPRREDPIVREDDDRIPF